MNRRDVLRAGGVALAAAGVKGLAGEAHAAIARPAAGGLAGCSFKDKQYVFFRDGADRLCQLVWQPNGRWTFADLTTAPAVRAPPIKGTPSITQLGDSLHLFYRTKFNKLAELVLAPRVDGARVVDTTWKHYDLTKAAGVAANVAADPASWALGNSLHAVYIGADQQMHELYWSGREWRHGALGYLRHKMVVAPMAAAAFKNTQFVFNLGGAISADQPKLATEVQSWNWSADTKWNHFIIANLRSLANVRPRLGTRTFEPADILGFSAVAAAATQEGVKPMIAFQVRGVPDHQFWLHAGQLVDTKSGIGEWRSIAAVDTQGEPLDLASRKTGVFTAVAGVDFSTEVEIHTLDLTREREGGGAFATRDSGTAARPTGSPAVWTHGDSLHVAFKSADGHIHELTFDTSWRARDLTQLASQ